jgi:maltose O-acetyltransferase
MFSIGANSSILMQVRFLNVKRVMIGKNSTVNYGTLIDSRGGDVKIGNNVNISNSVFIYTLEHDPQSPSFDCKFGDVVIEDHAWVASRATILPGVRIGQGAVVACGAVVTKDVAAYTMVGGIPAKVIGKRTRDLRYETNYFPWFM